MTDIITEIDDYSININQNPERCMEVMKEILSKLTNFEARRQRDENGEDPQTKFANVFVEFGGVDTILRLLMMNSLLPPEAASNEDKTHQLRVKSVALEILSRIISTEPGDALAKRLTEFDDILNHVFTYLAYDMTCLTACQVLEDFLQARQTVLNLSTISNIRRLVTCLDDKKLANFCRVLAVTISDLDIYEDKSSLFAQHRQKNAKGFINVRDVNQEMLLSIQDLVPRLVKIAVAYDYAPRYRDMKSELDCWMKWIDDQMSDDAFEPLLEDDLDKFVGGVSEPVQFCGPMVKQAGLEISKDLILRVKVIYVLGLFLAGKARKKVQKKLAELQLIPGLSELFEQFIWKCQGSFRTNTRNRLRGHNSSCECSPEVALKIQFLRLIHSFCDHSDYKHLLLTKSELSELKRINSKAGPLEIDGLDKVNKSLMCRGSKGLLTKIVEVMKKEPTASTFRFWLARAVESYLRGNTSFCDQVFLLKKGLLQHIANNIIDQDIRPKEILQSSFDLLGELVKFNVEAFKAFDKVLDSHEKAEKFVYLISKNLVDSNMFIRALILSLEQLTVTQPEYKVYAMTESYLLMHIARFDKQVTYLKKLINVINVQNLTQENVSCLNTTLVFLMFAHRRRDLPRYLRALLMDSTDAGARADCSSNLSIMRNFRDLLSFWQEHYLHKDKDCSALEKSSRLQFDYWKETVSTLLSDDRTHDTSVLHYVEPDDGRHS